jgi:hypothetical protein
MSSAGTGLFNIYDMLLYKLLPSSANLQSIFLSREGISAHSGQSFSLGDNIVLIFYLFTLEAQVPHSPSLN